MSDDEEYEKTHVAYLENEEYQYKFVFFSEWAEALWTRVLGRPATEFEEAIENERYKRKPKDLA